MPRLPDHERLKKYLLDALEAATYLQSALAGKAVGEYFDKGVKWIAERGIELTSEALKRAYRIERHPGITDLQKVFDTHNMISHEYELVDPGVLCLFVNDDLPNIIEEIKAKLATL
jgi:uncharacterized protein with HEPN domain